MLAAVLCLLFGGRYTIPIVRVAVSVSRGLILLKMYLFADPRTTHGHRNERETLGGC